MLLGDVFLVLISGMILFVCVLVGVAYLVLLERKTLSYIQCRKGPNKLGVMGLFQPLGDAVKLFSKEQVHPYMVNFCLYYFSPVFNLFLSLFMWVSLPYMTFSIGLNFSFLFFFCVSSLGVYSVVLSGWASNSNFSLLGSVRAIAQIISYEVSLILIMIFFFFLVEGVSLINFLKFQGVVFLFLNIPLCLMMLVSMLAETSRTPFDFAEGESELVSGFNVEYSSGSFAFIFLAEYSVIIFMSVLYSLMFLGGDIGSFMFFIKVSCVVFVWLWVRGTLPRFRYDRLMYLAWKSYLPVSLSFLFMSSGILFLSLFI